MKCLSVCTDGKAHVFDASILDMTELIRAKCRYCGVEWEDILDELARYEFAADVREHEEGECGV